MTRSMTVTALQGVPPVQPGDNLIDIIQMASDESNITLLDNDILVLAQKVVSKAEGRYIDLAQVTPSETSTELAAKVDKDPRLVEVILGESEEVVRYRDKVLIVQHKLGFVHANAGIDQSNLPDSDRELVLLLPEDPDASALTLKKKLFELMGVNVNIIINDSFGRAWRHGSTGIAIGSAGFAPLSDLRGKKDLFGRELAITQVAIADELAAAASLLMGQADEGTPIVLIRGLDLASSDDNISCLIRPKTEDLFR